MYLEIILLISKHTKETIFSSLCRVSTTVTTGQLTFSHHFVLQYIFAENTDIMFNPFIVFLRCTRRYLRNTPREPGDLPVYKDL